MSNYEFTDDEKRLIYLCTQKRSTRLETLSHYGVYVLPSLLFAGYALWRHDLIAAITAYIALLVAAVLYLSKAGEYSATLASICRKSEAMSKALKCASDKPV
jgi:hypothetical protein